MLEIETIHIILHISLTQIKPETVAWLISNFSFLDYFSSIVDGLDYLKAITNDHIFLHHLAKEVILHFTNDASFLDDLDILH